MPAGGTTMYVNGVDPGFSGDLLPLAALSLTARADSVLVQEICDYGSYDDAEFTGVSFGFGTTPDTVPMLFLPGVLASIWGGPVRLLADELGVELDEIRERYQPWVATEPIDCTMMHVEPGEVAAVRFAVEGIVDGEPRIVMEHVNRLTSAAAPDWPVPPEGRPGVHRVVVTGSPGVEINTHLGLDGVDHNVAGVIATAAKAVNAIPVVCAAHTRTCVAARPPRLPGQRPDAMTPARRSDLAPARPTRKVGRAQRRGDRTRDTIIDETVRCINEEGFAAASANHIAERAGVTWGVIQYHFGDRSGLLSAVVAHGFQGFRRAVQSVSVPDGSPAMTGASGGRCRLVGVLEPGVAGQPRDPHLGPLRPGPGPDRRAGAHGAGHAGS